LLGIFTLVGLAWALGFRKSASLTDAGMAAAEAAVAIAGFDPAEAVVSDSADAAIVVARDGRLALVRCFGDRLVVRLLKGAQARVEGGTLHLRLAEPGFPDAALVLGADTARWGARV
ncbi:hypothetical protein, partial [Polymorphobacter multimanifer]|uniref:hypothetical protein n=1 Tax=Polymorphobacter multimanifer TaxID=1070431 RepID=UPI001663BF9D